MYRVLIIPGVSENDSGTIDLSSEIDRIVAISNEDLQVDVAGSPTELSIVERLSIGGDAYDALHMLGHADDNGFPLSNTEVLTPDRIRKLCIDAGARLIFINSCVTPNVGQYVVNNGVAVAICYASPVVDNDAIINAMRFYSTLARSNEPFEDGLREAYNAADPGDGSLMWLTNGEYVQQIIKPLMMRFDDLENMHQESFSAFGKVIGTTKNVVQDIDSRLSGQIARLSANTKHTRYALISLIGIVLISTFALGWLISSVRTSSAQSLLIATATAEEPVPPTPILTSTWTPRVPPKDTRGATPQKPTRSPGTIPGTIPISTATLQPTSRPPTPTDTPYQTSTDRPTATVLPTSTQSATSVPQDTVRHTATPTTWPTVYVPPLPTATATLTAFEMAVRDAVEATMAAGGCSCQ